MKVVLTAGFDRSPSALAIAELLRRESIEVSAVVVVSPFGTTRVRSTLRRFRLRDLPALARKLAGKRSPGPLTRFLQHSSIRSQPLSEWARINGVPLHRTADLNHPSVIQFLHSLRPDWIVYGGGGILRNEILTAGTWRVINAHLGPLPEIRGMNAAEWSVLLGLKPAATVHLIDEGIDTGAVFHSREIDLTGIDDVEALRQQAVVTGIEAITQTLIAIRSSGEPTPRIHDVLHRQCFTLSPALKELLERRLAANASGSR
ncbi:MAG: formyltransferase family protein [Acidobacteriota bacterium]